MLKKIKDFFSNTKVKIALLISTIVAFFVLLYYAVIKQQQTSNEVTKNDVFVDTNEKNVKLIDDSSKIIDELAAKLTLAKNEENKKIDLLEKDLEEKISSDIKNDNLANEFASELGATLYVKNEK